MRGYLYPLPNAAKRAFKEGKPEMASPDSIPQTASVFLTKPERYRYMRALWRSGAKTSVTHPHAHHYCVQRAAGTFRRGPE